MTQFLLALFLFLPTDNSLEIKVTQVQYLEADSAEVVPSPPGVLILAENIKNETQYGIKVEVLNQPNRYIAVYQVVDPNLGLVAFPPRYINAAPGQDNVYYVTGIPNTHYWIEIRSSDGPPVIEKVIIAPGEEPTDPTDPVDPVDPPTFKLLTEEVRKLVVKLNESDVQAALYNVYNSFSPETTVKDSNNKLFTLQSDVLLQLGSKGQLNKDWYNGFVLPVDALLVALSDKIKTGADFGLAVKAIAEGLAPTPSQAPTLTNNGTVTLFTNPSCTLCSQWLREVWPALEKSGWKLEEIQSDGVVPVFEVCTNGFCQRHEGYMSLSKFTEVVNSMRR